MPKAVSRMLTLLCALVVPVPVGTNLGLRTCSGCWSADDC